jgi:hypothetical protein
MVTNILGTYLELKVAKFTKFRLAIAAGKDYMPDRFSSMEVKKFLHVVDSKLVKVSTEVLKNKKRDRDKWEQTLSLFRRQGFIEFYCANGVPRSFAAEVPGRFELRPVDDYSMGGPAIPLPAPTTSIPRTLALLDKVRTVILIHDTTSMLSLGLPSWSPQYSEHRQAVPCTESRWYQVTQLVAGVTEIVSKYNSYGIDLHFVNRNVFSTRLQTKSDVYNAFNAEAPHGGNRSLGDRTLEILDGYMCTLLYYQDLPALNLLIITGDKSKSDTSTLFSPIDRTFCYLRRWPRHVGIEFVQVGDCPKVARDLLAIEEKVAKGKQEFQREAVDVFTADRIQKMSPEILMELSLGGIHARMNGYTRR